MPKSRVSADSTKAASLQPTPIHGVRQSTSQAAALPLDPGQNSGPVPGPSLRSSIPARHTEAVCLALAGAVGAQLDMRGPSLNDHAAGSSTRADWSAESNMTLCDSCYVLAIKLGMPIKTS